MTYAARKVWTALSIAPPPVGVAIVGAAVSVVDGFSLRCGERDGWRSVR